MGAASGGAPAVPGVLVLSQMAGASLGLGRLLFSCVSGKAATPEGSPEVLGVGACAWVHAPAASIAIIATVVTDRPTAWRRSTIPAASQSPTKKVMAR